VGKDKILALIEKELVIALGCTEPVAIALAAATAKSYVDGEIEELIVKASGNIIKNAKSVGIPGMSGKGLEFSAAIGAVAGNPKRKLELLEGLKKDDENRAFAL